MVIKAYFECALGDVARDGDGARKNSARCKEDRGGYVGCACDGDVPSALQGEKLHLVQDGERCGRTLDGIFHGDLRYGQHRL